MKDLYDREQEVLDQALHYLESVKNQECCDRKMYAKLVKEYERILRLVKQFTRFSDKTAVELNADKTKLLDKVNLDALTGIYNRHYFDDEFQNVIKSCSEHQNEFGILMLDVDFFKLFNDTYGHSAGDECLRKIAKALADSLPKDTGFVSRYGGEEFVVVLPKADEAMVQEIAGEILKNVKNLKILHEKNCDKGFVTISIGGTSVKHVTNMKQEIYVNCADTALYKSKQNGRDCFTLSVFKEDNNGN